MYTHSSTTETLHIQRLTEKVVEVVTDRILTGYYSPDEFLPTQKEMAEKMGVSLTVIREALKILHSKGLVRIKHGIGTHINPTSAWKIGESLLLVAQMNKATLHNWLEARIILEVEIAGLAAERMTEENLTMIAAALQNMRVSRDDPLACMEADQAYHLAIARASENPSLVTLMQPVLQPLKGSILQIASDTHSVAVALAEHDAIYAALTQHDATQARNAMRQHLLRVHEEIEALNKNM
ncbi:MAG: FadR family transcriptional regulator [Chloroflexi bacterium]|nr:FadR family transcriptional regulator [Chloroflexota bacterium]